MRILAVFKSNLVASLITSSSKVVAFWVQLFVAVAIGAIGLVLVEQTLSMLGIEPIVGEPHGDLRFAAAFLTLPAIAITLSVVCTAAPQLFDFKQAAITYSAFGVIVGGFLGLFVGAGGVVFILMFSASGLVTGIVMLLFRKGSQLGKRRANS